MKALLFALLVSVIGCAHAQPRVMQSPYKVKHFSQEELHKVVSYAHEAFGGDLRGWSIILTDAYIMQQGEKEGEILLADGITIPATKTIIVFAYNECLADSALVHEIGHVLGYSHAEVLRKMVEKVEEMAIRDLCPPGYVKGTPPDPMLMEPLMKRALKGL